ncbi:MAG: sodium:calcium antiporter [Gammaproteobacteria bacterium]
MAVHLALFVAAALVIAWGGVRLTRKAEYLARVTGLGQAFLGAVVIGAITSLAGTVTSVTAAATGHPDLAVSNALGGIAAQTTVLVIADILYRDVNLEHAAAAEANLLQGVLLILLLAIAQLAMAGPDISWLGIHPATPILAVTYLLGVRMVSRAHQHPMWYPRRTAATSSEPEEARGLEDSSTPADWIAVLGLTVMVAAAGWVVARSGLAIAAATGVSESLVGTLFTAVVTSLPELVIAVAAVRRGAVNLAVGNIIGGNTFDVLFLGLSDIAYRPGSVFHAVKPVSAFWVALCMALMAVLLLGFLRRQRRGVAAIGFEGAIVLVLYLGGVAMLVWTG